MITTEKHECYLLFLVFDCSLSGKFILRLYRSKEVVSDMSVSLQSISDVMSRWHTLHVQISKFHATCLFSCMVFFSAVFCPFISTFEVFLFLFFFSLTFLYIFYASEYKSFNFIFFSFKKKIALKSV